MQCYDLTIHFLDGTYSDKEVYAKNDDEAKRKAVYYLDETNVFTVCVHGIIED